MSTSLLDQQPSVVEPNSAMRRKVSETGIAALAASSILIYLYLRFLLHPALHLEDIPLYVAMAVGGVPLLWRLGRRLFRLDFGADLLAGISIVAAAMTGQYLVGTIIVLMLSGGNA